MLAAGEYEASFALPIEHPDDLNFSKRLLERFLISHGAAVKRNFDLRSLFPARIDVRLEFTTVIADSCQLYLLEPVDRHPIP